MLPGCSANRRGERQGALGYGVGRLVEESSGQRTEQIVFENSEDGYGLKVPPGAWSISAVGESQVVTAPWGEDHIAQSVPVLKGLPGYLWKPFTTPLEASPEFVAWQISRAVQVVHGLDISPEEIQERYLESGTGSRVLIRPEGLNVYDVLRHKTLILTKAAVEAVEVRLGDGTAKQEIAE